MHNAIISDEDKGLFPIEHPDVKALVAGGSCARMTRDVYLPTRGPLFNCTKLLEGFRPTHVGAGVDKAMKPDGSYAGAIQESSHNFSASRSVSCAF